MALIAVRLDQAHPKFFFFSKTNAAGTRSRVADDRRQWSDALVA
jgi:hypothetical protein